MDTQNTCLAKIIDVVMGITYEKMPEDVVKKTKECLADYLGIFINGTHKADSKHLEQALAEDIACNPESLALFMGSTARMLDIDDGHRFAMAHPGVVVNSAVIAEALRLGTVSGEKVIEALARGYEMYCYQGRVINPSAYLKRGIDATSVCGAAAAAVVAGTLMNFDSKQMCDAVSLAASLAGGLNQSAVDGSAQKYLVAGWGAKLGICAASLAAFQMGGPCRVFEGRLGFCNAFAPEPDLEYLNNPSLVWDIRYVYMKRYACVRRIHATLDAIGDIVRENKLSAGDIDSIEVYGSQFLYDAGGYEPKDMAQAQTSVPYVVSLLLNFGRVEDEIVEEHIGDKAIAEYSHKVKVIKDAEIIEMAQKDKSLWGAAKVLVTTSGGEKLSKTQIVPYGDPELPLPEYAVREKFMALASEIIDKEKTDLIWKSLEELENLENVCELFKSVLAEVMSAKIL